MIKKAGNLIFAWKQMNAFNQFHAKNENIVVYSEGHDYWPHFEPVLRHLWEDHRQAVTYLTSSRTDPVLLKPPQGITSFYIGDGAVRTAFFAGLRAKLVVMTMPDLHAYYIKKSPLVGHYAYIFHSINSCHMVYRPHAFDHYDSMFCVGPHQIKEIRALEEIGSLKKKKIIEHGYGRLEALMRELNEETSNIRPDPSSGSRPIKVLIAPSWGDEALLERQGGGFIEPLLKAGFDVILRPHPQTRRYHHGLLHKINEMYRGYANYHFEGGVASRRSLIEADLMISDFSGAATEFAFARLKPVLFVDVPRKINNPGYEKLGIDPIEVFIRSEIGAVIPENQLSDIVRFVEGILIDAETYPQKIAMCRDKYIFNLGKSGKVAAEELVKLFIEKR